MEHQDPALWDHHEEGNASGEYHQDYEHYYGDHGGYHYGQEQQPQVEALDPLHIEGFDPSARHLDYDEQQQQHLGGGGEHDLNFREQGFDPNAYFDQAHDPPGQYDPQQHYDPQQQYYDPQQHNVEYDSQQQSYDPQQHNVEYDSQHYQADYDPQQHGQYDPQQYDPQQHDPQQPQHHDAWSGIHDAYDHAGQAVHEAYDHARDALHDAYDHTKHALDAIKVGDALDHTKHGLDSAYDRTKHAVEGAWDTVKSTQAYGKAAQVLDQTREAVEGALQTVREKLPPPVVRAYDQARAVVESAVDHTKVAYESVKTKVAPTVTSLLSQLPFKTDKNSLIFYGASVGFVILLMTVILIAMKPKGASKKSKPKVINYDELIGAMTVEAPGWLAFSAAFNLLKLRGFCVQYMTIQTVDKSLTLEKVFGYPMGSLKSGRYIYQLEFLLPGGNLIIAAQKFRLYKIHFHMPSEHMIDSTRYKLEMQMIFLSDQGAYAVIAVFYDSGQVTNPFLNEIIKWKPTTQLNTNNLNLGTSFFRYWGSLTTPPCTQNVIWTLMTEVVPASDDQFNIIKTAMQEYNARPTQDLRGRQVSKNF
ncbi:hypothetical protein SELMODRAFT_407267 [Selaginella moellendorffii]|uniref:Alpha-carbonic anhydrase domain-containing protein n=1 Tax=Selaginella moellendorffii TaxID=88036 RepID=D8R4G9_SELML|nr:hypothetical protein SELMODRAFT_407267 [Selaginella moellendorffii]